MAELATARTPGRLGVRDPNPARLDLFDITHHPCIELGRATQDAHDAAAGSRRRRSARCLHAILAPRTIGGERRCMTVAVDQRVAITGTDLQRPCVASATSIRRSGLKPVSGPQPSTPSSHKERFRRDAAAHWPASQWQISRSTVWRRIERYRSVGDLTRLPATPSWRKEGGRLMRAWAKRPR